MQDPRTQLLRIIAHQVDMEVGRGRPLDEVLAELRKQQPANACWYERSSLRTFSAAVAASYTNESRVRLEPMIEHTFEFCGRCVDNDVLQGRAVEAILEEQAKSPNMVWYDPQMLRHYSVAVAALWKRRSKVTPPERSDFMHEPLYLPG